MQNDARVLIQDVKDVTEFTKKINIFDAIINTKLAWDAVSSDTIKHCFAEAGIFPGIRKGIGPTLELPGSVSDSDLDNADLYMDLPLSEYIAMTDKLEVDEPTRASDTSSYHITEDSGSDKDPPSTPQERASIITELANICWIWNNISLVMILLWSW